MDDVHKEAIIPSVDMYDMDDPGLLLENCAGWTQKAGSVDLRLLEA